MCFFLIRNATAAMLPVPDPHSPAPGRSVRRKMPTTKPSTLRRVRVSFAPHGRGRLNSWTASRERSRIQSGSPLEISDGTAKYRVAAFTLPWRSESDQPLITRFSVLVTGLRTGVGVGVADASGVEDGTGVGTGVGVC